MSTHCSTFETKYTHSSLVSDLKTLTYLCNLADNLHLPNYTEFDLERASPRVDLHCARAGIDTQSVFAVYNKFSDLLSHSQVCYHNVQLNVVHWTVLWTNQHLSSQFATQCCQPDSSPYKLYNHDSSTIFVQITFIEKQ